MVQPTSLFTPAERDRLLAAVLALVKINRLDPTLFRLSPRAAVEQSGHAADR